MDRNDRKELLETIKSQQEQLGRYEKRLRDLVSAYKRQAAEKEALEATLQALNQSTTFRHEETAKRKAAADAADNVEGGSEDSSLIGGDPLNSQAVLGSPSAPGATEGAEEVVSHLQEQVDTLTYSLAMVTAGKSQMEASFQADKKLLMEKQEETIRHHEKEAEKFKESKRLLEEQLSEVKDKVRVQQKERETDHSHSAMMLRELQGLLAGEREEKEKLENQVYDLQEQLHAYQATPEKTQHYEKQITSLSEELASMCLRLEETEENARKPSPLLLQLQREMGEVKAQHRMALQMEQIKAAEAEGRVEQVTRMEEERVAGLENKLGELSEVVGNYERLRNQDQAAIQRLRERVTQLDLENTALARAATKTAGPSQLTEDDGDLSTAALLEKMTQLKGLLKVAVEKEEKQEKPLKIEEVCTLEGVGGGQEGSLHAPCQQELAQLKEEFEAYKTRAQSVLKNRHAKDNVNNKEMETMKVQVNELKERVAVLRQNLEDQEEEHKKTVDDFRQRICDLNQRHKLDLDRLQVDYSRRASELELQLHKQRDRTLAMLDDKDQEIALLKQQLQHTYGTNYSSLSDLAGRSGGGQGRGQLVSQSSVQSDSSQDDSLSQAAEETVAQLLQKSSIAQLPTNSPLLHFVEEKARKEVEVKSLRSQKNHLESALRLLQDKYGSAEESHAEQLALRDEEIARLKRNQSREGANVEYLKNVVFSYFHSTDSAAKMRMLNAIMTILNFSRREREMVYAKKQSWWGYGYPPAPNQTQQQ